MITSQFTQTAHYKPAWLYEPLPFLYIFAGAIAFSILDGGFAGLSSCLLIAAGISVLHMRRSYRRAAQAKARKSYRSARH